MEPKAPEEFGCPPGGLPGLEVSAFALLEEAAQPSPDMGVQLVELLGGIPGTEVVAPPAQQGVQFSDQDPDILHPIAVTTDQLLHACSHLLQRLPRWPALEVVAAFAHFSQSLPLMRL